MYSKLNIDFPLTRIFNSIVPWLRNYRFNCHDGNCFYVNHARTGLRIALSALGLPKGSRIGVSLFNCLTVFNAIHDAGYMPEFIDITDDFQYDINSLDNAKGKISALIVTHFFGIPSNFDIIRSIINNLPIIEDCSHAFGSKYVDGEPIGTKGAFSIFSIGLGKFPSIGNGGLLYVNDMSYLEKIHNDISLLPSYPLQKEIMMIIESHIRHIIYRPYLYHFLSPLKKFIQNRSIATNMYKQCEARMPRYVSYIYQREFYKIEQLKWTQIQNFKRFNALLNGLTEVYIPNFNVDTINGFMFPVITKNIRILKSMRCCKNVELTSHFAKSQVWGRKFGYKGNCSNAEKICKLIICIPCHYNVKIK